MSQKITKIAQQMRQLLTYQDDFLAATHSQVYHSNLPLAESILKFQINHISEINEKFNATMTALSQQLVQRRSGYESTLRDQFQSILQCDYLPLLRINRYQITKLSLFGFDIYVEPLDAFLHILSRMDALKHSIIQSGNDIDVAENADAALEKGWDSYSLYAIHWKLSFNLYILKQYLMVGSKSFLRKDRDILFTGISNFYNGLVPALKEKECQKLLIQLAQLNNSLYFFHPSFNYFHFYTLLLPLADQSQPIFAFVKEIVDKCITTNIITPLLFGILRNRASFLRFIKEADSEIWLPYLNVIIAGVAINLKLRILQYEQILEVFEEAVRKAGLLGKIRTEQVLGKLDEGWKDAKQFFISAVKIGFNSGDAESWRSVDVEAIGPRIIGSLLDGMLLGIDANSDNIRQYLQNGDEKLDTAVRAISEDKIDMYFIKTTIYQLQNDLDTEKHLFSLIQICNLIKMLAVSNQYSLHFVISCFNKITITPNRVLRQRLAEAAASINEMLFQIGTSNLTFLKDKIVDFHKKFPPSTNFPKLIQFYFANFEPKKCLNHLLTLSIQENKLDDFFILVFNKYLPKPSSKIITLKTFDEEYQINNSYVNLSYESHCLLSFATFELTKGSKVAQKIIQRLIKICPWVNFALLNFPISSEGELFSFSSWLIDNVPYHGLISNILSVSKDSVLSDKGQDLIKILIFPSILDHLSKRINEIDQLQQLICLCNLAIRIAAKMQVNGQFLIDLMSVLLYLLEKTDNASMIVQIVNGIGVLSQLALKEKLKIWLLSLLQRRIQGRTELSGGHRKRILKTNHANIYFLGEIKETTETKPIIINLEEKVQPQLTSLQFEQSIKDLNKADAESLKQLQEKQNIILLQQIKLFNIPTKSKQVLTQIFVKKQLLTIDFLSLNFENHSKMIQYALQTKAIDHLCRQRLDKNLCKYISTIMELQKSSYEPILQKMSQNLSQAQRVNISENFFLDSAILSFYCQHEEGIQYLAVFNGNNWRILIEYFTKEFNLSNLPSVILQYDQFVKITSQKNGQYEKIISKYAQLLRSFVSFLLYKIDCIFSLPYSKQELTLRSANELSSLNMIVSSLQLKEVLIKQASLNKTLSQKSIQPLKQWINIIKHLNQRINSHYNGDIMMGNFMYGYYFTNQTVCQTLKTEIGVFLQKYQEIVNDISTSSHYMPSNIQSLPLKQFNQAKLSSNSPFVIQSNISQTLVTKHYFQLVKKMLQLQLIKLQGKSLAINLAKKVTQDDLKRFYMFGCYHALAGQMQRYKLTNLLEAVASRQKLSWQVLKQIDSQGYLHISSAISDAQIAKKNLTFTYRGEMLIANAEGIKVNDYNKIDYCNKIGLKLIGEPALISLRHFMRGFVYQRSQR